MITTAQLAEIKKQAIGYQVVGSLTVLALCEEVERLRVDHYAVVAERDAAQAQAKRMREALVFIRPTINRLSEGSLELHELDLRIDRALADPT